MGSAVLRRSRRPALLLAASLLALALGGAAAAAPHAGTEATDEPELDVSLQTLGERTLAAITIAQSGSSSEPPAARVELFVPQGYVVDLTQRIGSKIGAGIAAILDASGAPSGPAFADGVLVVADPATFATDPAAQACAPGTHAAAWEVSLSVLGQTLSLPIFLDPVTGPTPESGAYVLRLCPLWPPAPERPGGLTAVVVGLLVDGLIRGPSAGGIYTWSAFLTPSGAGTFAPDPSRTFEVRTIVPIPQKLTLRARYDAKTESAFLSGRFTVRGKPQARAAIRFTASTRAEPPQGNQDFSFFGPVKTNARGEFSVRRKVDRTTQFTASVSLNARSCSAPSSAPAGCRSETVADPDAATAAAIVPKATDPNRAILKRDQALARRASLTRADFPGVWESEPADPFGLCPGFEPDLSDLTITGAASSPVFYSDTAAAGSETSVYTTEKQARAAFTRTARVDLARCLAKEVSDDPQVATISPLAFPRYGSATRAFRVVFTESGFTIFLDLVTLRTGRVLNQFVFEGADAPFASERALVSRIAARARRG